MGVWGIVIPGFFRNDRTGEDNIDIKAKKKLALSRKTGQYAAHV